MPHPLCQHGLADRTAAYPSHPLGQCRPCTRAKYARYNASEKGRARDARRAGTDKRRASNARANARYLAGERGGLINTIRSRRFSARRAVRNSDARLLDFQSRGDGLDLAPIEAGQSR
jgi:hypothetical protein